MYIDDLRNKLGEGSIMTEDFERYTFSSDWSPRTPNQISIPDVVVMPTNTKDVLEIMQIAIKNRVPITVGGGLTGMGGGSIPLRKGIFIDSRRMNKVLDFDEKNQTITVEAGITLKELNDYVEKYGLWLPNLPESQWSCTIGSEIACDNDNTFGMRYGKILNALLSLVVVDGNGHRLQFGHRKAHFSSSGYKVKDLFVGSEGTLGVITEATLKLEPIPSHRQVEMFLMPSMKTAISVINECCKRGIALEACHLNCKRRLNFYTHAYTQKTGKTPNIPYWVNGLLAVSFAGDEQSVNFNYLKFNKIVNEYKGKKLEEREIVDAWWISKYTLNFEPFHQKWASSQSEKKFGAIDPAIPMGRLEEYYEEFVNLTEQFGLEILGMNAYFEHPNSIGLSLSCAVFVDYRSEDEINRFRAWSLAMSEKAIEYEGSISSYISDTDLKIPMMVKEHTGIGYEYMKKIKLMFDPYNILNPDKKFKFLSKKPSSKQGVENNGYG